MAVDIEKIRELRQETGAGVMEARRALLEANGDLERARKLLQQWGLVTAEKKAGRVASQGLIECYIHAGGRVGAMVELNCETDFVARTPEFKELARELAMQVAAMNPTRVGVEGEPIENPDEDRPLLAMPYIRNEKITVQDLISQTIAKTRENIVLRRFARFELGK
jgi:elongation factor Ts